MINQIKKRIGLDFVLLFILLAFFIFTVEKWHYIRFIPLQGPPYNFYFSFLFFLFIAAYFLVSLANVNREKKYYIKLTLVVLLIFIFIFTSLVYQVSLRKTTGNNNFIHDGAVETEEAVKQLSQGKNPYAADYRNTPFGVFEDSYSGGERDNPAWIHYVYLPFLPLSSLPFYSLSENLFSFYDQRIVYGLLFFLCLFFVFRLSEEKSKKIIGLIVFAFNPLFFPYFLQGYNDIFVFFWLLGSLYFLKEKRIFWSVVFIALACASKQSAWLILPFYLAYLYFREEAVKTFAKKTFLVFKKILPLIVLTFLIFTPFLIWSAGDFFDDVYRYPAGLIDSNFPMVGYGISHLIYKLGFVESIWDYYPFWIFQMIFCLPLLYYLIKKQKENNTLSNLVFSYGIFLLIFWFFSRFFNDNYISYLSLVFIAGYLIQEKTKRAV